MGNKSNESEKNESHEMAGCIDITMKHQQYIEMKSIKG